MTGCFPLALFFVFDVVSSVDDSACTAVDVLGAAGIFFGRPRGLDDGILGKSPITGLPFASREGSLGSPRPGLTSPAASDCSLGLFKFDGRGCKDNLLLLSQHFSSSAIIASLRLTALNP